MLDVTSASLSTRRQQYLERIAWMKSAKREISITTDVIVGFPGETEADFAETLSLLDEVGYDAIFAFKYSPRPNTPALGLDDAIPEEEKSRRLEVLMARQREIQIQSYKKYVGTVTEAMVEGRNPGPQPVDRPHFAEQNAQLHGQCRSQGGKLRESAGDQQFSQQPAG